MDCLGLHSLIRESQAANPHYSKNLEMLTSVYTYVCYVWYYCILCYEMMQGGVVTVAYIQELNISGVRTEWGISRAALLWPIHVHVRAAAVSVTLTRVQVPHVTYRSWLINDRPRHKSVAGMATRIRIMKQVPITMATDLILFETSSLVLYHNWLVVSIIDGCQHNFKHDAVEAQSAIALKG